MIWILFYYNSLPNMPMECCLFSKDVMHRDFFECNPTNTGHYQYPKFETLSYDEGCHKKEVLNFIRKEEKEKYVIFYTKHLNTISKEMKNKIVGYFKVGDIINFPKKGFNSSESVLLPKEKCIEIDYHYRGVPVSWGHSSIKNKVSDILNKLIANHPNNIASSYQNETLKIMSFLQKPSGRMKIIIKCQNCNKKTQCYWGKNQKQYMENKLNVLYNKSQSKCAK